MIQNPILLPSVPIERMNVTLKMEYVVTEITASPDGSPYVFISLADPHDSKERMSNPFGGPTSYRSPDDLFANLGRAFATQMVTGLRTVVKLALSEYEELGLRVGERIYLEISKV